jgi:Tfp pilus assembly protein PilF
VARRDGQAFDMQGLSIELDIDNRSKGTGSGSIKVASASASMGSLEGLELVMEAREKGDRMNSRFTNSVRKMEGAGQTLSDLRMEWALDGLHTASVETLIKLFQDSCGMDALTAKENQVAADALETLLAKGFSFGMPTLSGKAADGSIQGSFVVELTAAAAPALAEQLRSSGKLEIKGSAIPPEQRDMAVATGFAVMEGDTLSASYDYAKGLLKVNNRTMDAGAFEGMLSKADEEVRTALDELRNKAQVAKAAPADPQAAAPQAPEAAAEQAQAPAEAPASANAPAGDCNSVPSCVQNTLAAAQLGDLDAVRATATLMDQLPKPDLGNKAVARKLNAAALEALKQDDVAGAIAQLRQARQENPQDVEIAANLGFALVKADDPVAAQVVLKEALLLNPRRTSTWTPLAEALALSGQMDQAKAAIWVAFQWSSNRDKSLAFYLDRSTKETRPALAQLYAHMANVAEAAMEQDTGVANR